MTAPETPIEPSASSMPLPGGELFDLDLPPGALAQLGALRRQHGDLFWLRTSDPAQSSVFINHPDYVEHVLARHYGNYSKGPGIERVRILLGNGLMASEGEFWLRQRQMIQPSFHHRVLSQFSDLMVQLNGELVTQWHALTAAGQPLNLTEAMSRVTLDFILFALFSDDLEQLIADTGSNPFLLVSEESERNLLFARRFRELAEYVKRFVASRQEQQREPFDFLSMLMAARHKKTGEAMSEKQLLDEVLTMIVAGHETTASALNWTWYLISQHPDAEAKVLDEVDQVLAGRAPRFDDLPQLKYTRQVCQEALRLYPPGWLLTKRALADDTIGGYPVAAGQYVLISPYWLHRHPDFWAQPERFDPERFSETEEATRPRYAYIPFSYGPRNCIGDALALAEMQLHLATVLPHFKLTYSGPKTIELEAQINLRSAHDLVFTLEKR